ncbi:LOW QUALITY PROTEIN: papilin [Tupaia chinensis]|uniref:LOW QUALITY PROTEIN: papilin n=1 Tax=Tupaia chinensis TaxID=246437 RepID=UPI000FFC9539|nr:LOW QUALITY PROTEIN: papilin [Tupaia chinensis]
MRLRLLLLAPLLLAPTPTSSVPNVKRQSDTWGPWGEWSPCSRTCGGGISFRERPCYSQRRDGGSSCVGPARNHRSCRVESCPDGARDFRAEQCAEFDGVEFQGRRYRWLPYYGAPNKCALNCIPKGENFYYKHREAVVDGTPCEPGKRDVCVEGSCRAVGCDHELDSAKQEDKCLRCGGDGTACYPVSGTFDANDLQRGYNQILIVPPGATSIRMVWCPHPTDLGSVKNVHGEYYLNGHWTIEAAGALPVASTILQYERGTEGDLAPERLQARGPTSEPLVVELISQEPNPGVHYEYYLPLGSPRPGFSWSHGSWRDCSAECGGGHQSRLVFCTIDNEAYPDHMCQHQPRPAAHRSCNPHPCPHAKRWKTGPWSPCSASCGGGSQSRTVYCVLFDGAGVQEATQEVACAGLPGKPPTTQACNLQRCAAWSPEPWGECSVSCGAGVRWRSVMCRGDEGSLLHATACSLEDQPPLTEPCVREDCPSLSDQAWRVGIWGLCSKSCSSGTRRRQVVCALGPPSHCGSLQWSKPADAEPCNTQPCHLPQEVPSVQDVHTHAREPQMSSGPQEPPASDPRDMWGTAQEQPSSWDHPRGDQDPRLSARGPAPSLQQSPHRLPPGSSSGPGDCRYSPHGCCPDGHTASLGPQWQGCPGVSCQQSRYGCCPDGVSVAEGPHHAGCMRSNGGDNTSGRPGWRAVASTAPSAHQPQAQQNEPSECRGSQFGCCYDNVSPAAGALGEGCVGQPSYPYPVRCLLPSAHGSCRGRELGLRAAGLGGDAGRPAPPSLSSSYRIRLGGLEPALVQAALGQSVQLFCPEDTSLGAQAGWQKDGQYISSDRHKLQADGSLVISPLRAEDAGTYSRASSGPGHGSQEIQLRVTGPYPHSIGQWTLWGWRADAEPEAEQRQVPETRGSGLGRLRGSLLTPPMAPGVPGLPSTPAVGLVQFMGPGLGNQGGDSSGGGVLAGGSGPLEGALRRGAEWMELGGCSTSHQEKQGSGGLQLSIASGRPALLPPTLPLTPHTDSPWAGANGLCLVPRHQLQPDGSLVISQVAVEDGGFYTCVTFNGQDRDQRWVQLRVLGELMITGLPRAVTVPEGDTARLSCVVAEGVNVRWSRNGLPVPADGHRVHQSPDGTLLIHNVRARDQGSYTCSAYRGSQAVSRSTEVKVGLPAPAAQARDPGRECIDQPELANCDLILRAQLCGNEYYSSFCCASCSHFQPHALPVWQQG